MPTEDRTAAAVHESGYVCRDDSCDCDCMIIETLPETPTGIQDVTLPVIRRIKRSIREPTVASTPSVPQKERVAGDVNRVGFPPATVSTWQRKSRNRPMGIAHRIPIPDAVNKRLASLRLAGELLQAQTLASEALSRLSKV